MQKTQQPHEELVKVYAMIGAVVMAMAGDGLETTRLRIAGFIRGELARTDVWSPEMKTLRNCRLLDYPFAFYLANVCKLLGHRQQKSGHNARIETHLSILAFRIESPFNFKKWAL